ncbi:polar amino acid ABC transporter, inner membrane subunit, partial [Limnospira maxima CS-328]
CPRRDSICSQGQWEAARSLGLKSGLVMRLVVFPQALRVIIPPLNSQYLNLAKNSSLAIAVAYADLYNVANTTFNQSGRAVEVMLIIMAAYLTINLIISLFMNFLNRRVQLQER